MYDHIDSYICTVMCKLVWAELKGGFREAQNCQKCIQLNSTYFHNVCMCVSLVLQSCLELKNYEAVFALMKGLESRTVQQAEGSWQVQLVMTTQYSHSKVHIIVSVLHCVHREMGNF